MKRVAVTGVGLVTALGGDVASTWSRLAAGESGVREATLPGLSAWMAQVHALTPTPTGRRTPASRSEAFAAQALGEAFADAGAPRGRVGLVVGASTGGMYEVEHLLAELGQRQPDAAEIARLLAYPLSNVAESIAGLVGATRWTTLCSACSSGALAVALGAQWLDRGDVDVVFAGGVDALCRLTALGFEALGAVAPTSCRPFDRQRAGLTLGEGAAFLALERETGARARNAPARAWLSGLAVGAEAHHITQPDPTGEPWRRLVTRAVHDAGLRPEDVAYVNAHGTGTPQNDPVEAVALRAALGDAASGVRVSSTKGALGHALAAAGAIEAAVTVLAVQHGIAPPTVGLENPITEGELRHVIRSSETLNISAALSSSFGFGGTGVVLAFTQAGSVERGAARPRARVYVGAPREWSPERGDPLRSLDPARSRRFDRTSALAAALGSELGVPGADTAVVLENGFGAVTRSIAFVRRAFERGPRFASPAEFPHLVPSAPAGNASIYLRATGPAVTVAERELGGLAALGVAADLVASRSAQRALTGAIEAVDDSVERVLAPLFGVRAREASTLLALGEQVTDALAELLEVDTGLDAALPVPRSGGGLVVAIGEGALRWLAGSAWSDAETVAQPAESGAGARAVALAVLAVARSQRDALVVLTHGDRRAYAHLVGLP